MRMAGGTKNFLEVCKFYDTSLEEKFSIYDKMPYERDWGLCGFDSVKLHSGNVVKYYSYKQKENNFLVPADRES